MFDRLYRKFTYNYEKVPLFFVTFNLNKYLEQGEEGSCDFEIHPCLKDDAFVIEQLNSLVNHIMLDRLYRKFTYNYEKLSLFFVTFNLNKYLEHGEKGSCDLELLPCLKDDEFIIEQLNGLVDHIRKNYDMENLSK